MADAPDKPRTIDSVEKCCNIIDVVHEQHSATLTEIANELDLTPGTVHPYLVTLNRNELITREDNLYLPGLRFLTVGERRRRDNVLYRHSTESMQGLATKTDTLVQTYAREFGIAVCVAVTGGENSISPPDPVGHRTHLHCLAAGKAILAGLPDDHVKEILDHRGLPKRTDNTIVDRAELLEELEQVADQGYAFNNEEYIPGLQAVGTAITDGAGHALGAISASAPTKRMDESKFRNSVATEVMNVANTIELNIRVEERD